MATTNDNGKAVASFQTDQAVRKKILHLIKRKRPKSDGNCYDGQFNNNSEEVHDDPLTGKPFKVSRTYGRKEHFETFDPTSSLNHSEHGRVQCSTCGQMYNSAQLLDKHFRRVHLKERPHLCQFCDYRGFYKREVVLHEQRTHIKEKSFKCPYCDYATTDNESLYSHLATHSTNKAFKCARCPYSCSWKKQLARHEQAHESPDKIECKQCGIVSRDKKQDLVHFSIEHSVKTFTTNVNKNTARNGCGSSVNEKPLSIKTNTASDNNTTNSEADDYHLKNVQISSMRSGGQTSQKVMLTSDTVGLSLANLLSMDNDSFSSLTTKSPTSNDPQLIISKDEVANHFQVLNVSDLVKKHSFNEQSFIPQILPVDNQNELNNGLMSNNLSPPPQTAKPKVSLLKSAIRSEVRQKLIEASFRRTQSTPDTVITRDDVTFESDSNSDTNSACSHVDETSSSSLNLISGCDVPIVDSSMFDSLNTVVAMTYDNAESEIDVGSETEADFLSRNNIDSSLLDEILNMSHNAVDDVFYDKPPAPLVVPAVSPLEEEEQLSSDDPMSQESIDRELQSFIDKFERQQAAAAQEKKSVLYLDRSDLHEIINLIESKMNGDPTVATPTLDHVTPHNELLNESQYANARVQVVLQVPNGNDCDYNNMNTDDAAPAGGKAVASIELSYLDQMLKQLLSSKGEQPIKP